MRTYSNLYFLIIFLLISCKIQDNVELSNLATQDQYDRSKNNPLTEKNDNIRKAKAQELLDANALETSNDYFNAALIFQHGETPEDYLKANELAQKSLELNKNNLEAKRLIAQSKDRYLLRINKPQIYGTQRTVLGDLEYLRPIDTTKISDQKRLELGILPLSKKLEYFNNLHNKKETSILAYVPSDSLYRVYFPEKRADLIGTFTELVSKINYPKEAKDKHITGKVLVQYTITPQGNVKDIIVVDGIGYGCDEEAARVISTAKFKNYLNRDIERRTRIPFELEK